MKQSKTLRRWELALLLGVACAALLGVWLDGAQAALSDQVIRLHVLANSDSEADQALKLRVRDRILAEAEELFVPGAGRAETEELLRAHLYDLAAAGAEVRIWADDTPDGACGLRHAAALLAGLDARVTLVSLPRWWERPDGAVVRWERGWGEVHPEEFGLHLGGAEELTRPVLRMLALEWERLREENAPLRAVVNGRVMGVSEDFYDPVLRRCLTEKPQKVANVLGQALVQLSGVGDWLLARRLRAMAEAGTVRVDEAGSTRGFYGAAVCLS